MSKSLPKPVNRQSSTSAGHSWAPINSSISELLQPPMVIDENMLHSLQGSKGYRLGKNQETCRSKPSVVVVSCLWANLTLLSEQVYHDLYNFFQNLVWRGFPFNHPCTEAYMKLNQRKNAALNHGSFMQLFSGSLWQSEKSIWLENPKKHRRRTPTLAPNVPPKGRLHVSISNFS